MRHQSSVLHQVLKHVPWATFEQLVKTHGADHRVRRLSTKSQFIALLYGQLAGAASLRDIETALLSHRSQLYHFGGCSISRSTLADANANRPAAVFADLFRTLVARASRGLRRTVADAVHLIGSTTISLAGVGATCAGIGATWAELPKRLRQAQLGGVGSGEGRISDDLGGVKAHIIHDPDSGLRSMRP